MPTFTLESRLPQLAYLVPTKTYAQKSHCTIRIQYSMDDSAKPMRPENLFDFILLLLQFFPHLLYAFSQGPLFRRCAHRGLGTALLLFLLLFFFCSTIPQGWPLLYSGEIAQNCMPVFFALVFFPSFPFRLFPYSACVFQEQKKFLSYSLSFLFLLLRRIIIRGLNLFVAVGFIPILSLELS